MLAKAKRVKGEGREDEDDAVGPSIIVEYDPEVPNDRPYWLEPPGVTQDVFDKRLDRDVQEIHRLAKMGGIATTAKETSKSPKSGIALELEFRMMNSALAEKADNAEEAHQRICDLFAKWQSIDQGFTGNIDYPDDFNVEDLAEDLENAIQATQLRISGRFNTEMKKRLVRVAMPKLQAEVAKEIEEQIEAQKDLFIPAEFGLLLQYNLSNPVEIIMALRGVEEAEAIKILDRNKELTEKYSIPAAPAAPDLSNFAAVGEEEGEEE